MVDKQNVVKDDNDIVDVYDALVEFNDYCSFFCDAVFSLSSESMRIEPDPRTIAGLKRHCSDLKERARQLEAMLIASGVLNNDKLINDTKAIASLPSL